MVERSVIEEQLQNTLKEIEFPELGSKIAGKVRDSYVKGDKRILITSDRLSAFDKILTTIPFKGQILNQMAAYWFRETKHIIRNHIIDIPHPNVFVAQQVDILPIEVIVRGYLTGSAWRDYQAGKDISGITLPQGMKKSQRFETPLLTPSTKAEQGEHDEPISEKEILERGIVAPELWEQVSSKAQELFAFGTERAKEQGLILVDTKYEFGTLTKEDGSVELVLADEIHTSDSSRYWIVDSYEERFAAGEDPQMLDKEFVRRALIEKGYMGDGEPPVLDEQFRVDTALRYIEALETITGESFQPTAGDAEGKIKSALGSFT